MKKRYFPVNLLFGIYCYFFFAKDGAACLSPCLAGRRARWFFCGRQASSDSQPGRPNIKNYTPCIFTRSRLSCANSDALSTSGFSKYLIFCSSRVEPFLGLLQNPIPKKSKIGTSSFIKVSVPETRNQKPETINQYPAPSSLPKPLQAGRCQSSLQFLSVKALKTSAHHLIHIYLLLRVHPHLALLHKTYFLSYPSFQYIF